MGPDRKAQEYSESFIILTGEQKQEIEKVEWLYPDAEAGRGLIRQRETIYACEDPVEIRSEEDEP